MSRMIFPASGKKIDWSPSVGGKIQKEAQVVTEGIVEVSEPSDPILDALRNVPTIGTEVGELLDKAKSALDEAKDAVEAIEASEVAEGEIKPEDVKPADAPCAPCAEEKPEEAKKEVEIEIPEKAEADEIEIEIEDEPKAEEKAEEKTEEKPAEADLEKESKKEPVAEEPKTEEKPAEEKKEDEKMACSASHDFGSFIHIAKLSKENKKDLVNYWKNMLGYPSEYVDAMVKDYE